MGEGAGVVIADPVIAANITQVLDDGTTKRLAVDVVGEVDANIRGPINKPSDLSKLVIDKLKNAGSASMIVDGSGTPVVFKFDADPTEDIQIRRIRVLITTDNINFIGDQFIEKGPVLPNGCLLEITYANGTTVQLVNIARSEDLLELPFDDQQKELAASKDWWAGTVNLPAGIILKAGTGDNVKMTIRDDLAAGLGHIKYVFEASISGEKV